jgi:hypothetical protein
LAGANGAAADTGSPKARSANDKAAANARETCLECMSTSIKIRARSARVPPSARKVLEANMASPLLPTARHRTSRRRKAAIERAIAVSVRFPGKRRCSEPVRCNRRLLVRQLSLPQRAEISSPRAERHASTGTIFEGISMDTAVALIVVCAVLVISAAVRVWLVVNTFDDMIAPHSH